MSATPPSALNTSALPTLNLIGGGRLGRTLGHVFATRQVFRIQQVLTQSLASAEAAVSFIGQGAAIASLAAASPADMFMLAVPDTQLSCVSQHLAQSGLIRNDTLIFHCSGALASDVLRGCAEQGARTASAHPLLSFADPTLAVQRISGCYCALEGERSTVATLAAAFETIGMQTFVVDTAAKINYHAAAVIASNYLVTLTEAALQAAETAHIPRAVAQQFLLPLMQQTVGNLSTLMPADALTGPIARGDMDLVRQQHAALAAANPALGALYATLANATAALAKRDTPFKP